MEINRKSENYCYKIRKAQHNLLKVILKKEWDPEKWLRADERRAEEEGNLRKMREIQLRSKYLNKNSVNIKRSPGLFK